MRIRRSSVCVSILIALSPVMAAVGCGASAAPSPEPDKVVLDTAYLSSFGFLARENNRIEAPDSLLRPFFDQVLIVIQE